MGQAKIRTLQSPSSYISPSPCGSRICIYVLSYYLVKRIKWIPLRQIIPILSPSSGKCPQMMQYSPMRFYAVYMGVISESKFDSFFCKLNVFLNWYRIYKSYSEFIIQRFKFYSEFRILVTKQNEIINAYCYFRKVIDFFFLKKGMIVILT